LSSIEEEHGVDTLNGEVQRMVEEQVVVAIPRFKFTKASDLPPGLRALGMKLPFEEGKADFSEMTDAKHEALFIRDVFHQAVIVVDEHGAKAAAATHVAPAKDGPPAPPRQAEFIADRPFLFIIRHDPTGLILFVGRVSDPRG